MRAIDWKGVLAAGAVLLAGCVSHGEAPLEGEWLQPVPGMAALQQGFRLQAGGKAGSVGMATLQYESWSRERDELVLTGCSIGNGQTIPFADTLRIVRLSADSLVVACRGGEQIFVKTK